MEKMASGYHAMQNKQFSDAEAKISKTKSPILLNNYVTFRSKMLSSMVAAPNWSSETERQHNKQWKFYYNIICI